MRTIIPLSKIIIYIHSKINQFHFYQTQTLSYLKNNNKSTSFCSSRQLDK